MPDVEAEARSVEAEGEAEPVTEPETEHDDGSEFDSLPAEEAGEQLTEPVGDNQPEAAPAMSIGQFGAGVRLYFSTGDVLELDRTVVVGRAPVPRGLDEHDAFHLMSVPSPNNEISSTHVEIRPGPGGERGVARVKDLGSTNGTMLRDPGLPPAPLRPGEATPVGPDAVIDLGDGVTVRIVSD